MTTVLVTGGSGFIGSHLVDRLATLDSVGLIISLDINASSSGGETIINLKADITCDSELESALIGYMDRIEFVVHLAARPGVRWSVDHPIECAETNIVGTVRILEIARRMKNLKRVVLASSSSVYGDATLACSETSSTDHPSSLYAASKKASEVIASSYSNLYKMDIVCLRFFTVYGPRGRPDMAILRFIDAMANDRPIDVYGDGSARRDFTHIDDVISGIVRSLDVRRVDSLFSVFNIAGGRSVSVSEVVSHIANALRCTPAFRYHPPQAGDVLETRADLTEARRALGYEPHVDIITGIKRTVDWYIATMTKSNSIA